MNRIVGLIYHHNPLATKYKAHEKLPIVAQATLENHSVVRRFFKTEAEVLEWYEKLKEEGRLIVH